MTHKVIKCLVIQIAFFWCTLFGMGIEIDDSNAWKLKEFFKIWSEGKEIYIKRLMETIQRSENEDEILCRDIGSEEFFALYSIQNDTMTTYLDDSNFELDYDKFNDILKNKEYLKQKVDAYIKSHKDFCILF